MASLVKQSIAAKVKEIEEVSQPAYMWVIGERPAYFVQYQLKSAAVLQLKQMILIVWKPKYIEYPSMFKFPELKDKKRTKETILAANLSITV